MTTSATYRARAPSTRERDRPCVRASARCIALMPALTPAPVFTLSLHFRTQGTWAWGNKLLWQYDTDDDETLREAYDLVVSAGVNVFDSADSYGTGKLEGRAETLLGDFGERYTGRVPPGGVNVITKLAAYPWRVTAGQMVSACEASRARLGGGEDCLALAQLHWSAAKYAPLQERGMVRGLVEIYERGLARGVGLSNYGPRELARVERQLREAGVPLASNQVQYSLLSFQGAPGDTKAACDDLGVTMIAYSPLGLGMLTGKYSASERRLPPGVRGRLMASVLPGAAPLLECLEMVADERGKTQAQVAINWTMCKGALPIVGAKDVSQARENLGALGWRLADGEVDALEDAARMSKGAMTQNVFMTG